MKKIIFYNIELIKTGLSMSGGETCLIELIKHWSKNHLLKNIIYTSENGVVTYGKFVDKKNKFYQIGNYWVEEKFGVFVSCLYKTVLSLFHLKTFESGIKNIIISHSDFWPTVIFAYLLKKKNPQAKWFAFNHMLAPNPFKGFKYQYVRGKYKIPSLTNLHYWLNQRLFFLLAKKANCLVAVNSQYINYFKKHNDNVLLIQYSSDVEDYMAKLPTLKLKNKKYDACFIGRFHEQKGIYEIIDIIENIVKLGGKDFKCIVVGDYHNAIGQKFVNLIKTKKLENNFEIAGSKIGLEKYLILNNSKVFLFPSYYESFGIVYLEAISLGVPVFEYNLPIYQDHKFGVIKVPYLENRIFAKKIIGLLENEEQYNKVSKEGIHYSKSFSWEKTANLIYNHL